MASILELAQTLRQLIKSFKDSEFYKVVERDRDELVVLGTKMRKPVIFAIGVKNDGADVALAIGHLYFAKTRFRCSIRSPRNDLDMPTEPEMDASVNRNFMWTTTEEVIRQTFEEAIMVVKTAKELEKQGLYFAEPWVPWVMKRTWVEDKGRVIPTGKRDLKKRIEKVYDERVLLKIKDDVSRASTIEEIKELVPSEQIFNEGKTAFVKEWMEKRKVPSIREEEEQ